MNTDPRRPLLAAARVLALVAAAACALGAGTARAQVDEYDVKTAFVYNLALFTVAADAREGDYAVCVFGRDPFGARLKALETRTIDKRRIAVRNVASVEALAGCSFVFFGQVDRRERVAALRALAGRPVVTATESTDFPQPGLMYHLDVERQRVVVDVNQDALRTAGMQVGTQMLRVARRVHGASS